MKIVDSIKNQNMMSDLYCKQLRTSLFLLLIALTVCGCKSDYELPTEPTSQVVSPAPAAGADSIVSVLEEIGSWRVMAIIQTEGVFSYNLSSDGTTACFADGEVTFAVPYTSISFDTDNEPTTEYEQYGPYSVSYQSSNTLTIADELFHVSPLVNGDSYTLLSENIEIRITK